MRCKNLNQFVIAVDQLIFCLVGLILSLFNPKIEVYADMTISAQAYRLYKRDEWYGVMMKWFIDLLFEVFTLGRVKNHCYMSYLSEKTGHHLPDDLTN